MSAYDLFHFCDSASLLPRMLDLPVLNALGRKTAFTMNGTSSRLRSYCLRKFRFTQYGIDGHPWDDAARDNESAIARNLRTSRRYADVILALNPDLCNDVEGSVFLPYAKRDAEGAAGAAHSLRYGIVIGHAPTNRLVKRP